MYTREGQLRGEFEQTFTSFLSPDVHTPSRAMDSGVGATAGRAFDNFSDESHFLYCVRTLLSKWLEYNVGILWVLGKAVSGKSIVMNPIGAQPNFPIEVANMGWVNPARNCAPFLLEGGYNGTEECSRLLPILLVPDSTCLSRFGRDFCTMWDVNRGDLDGPSTELRLPTTWTARDLTQVLLGLLEDSEEPRYDFCFFIDASSYCPGT